MRYFNKSEVGQRIKKVRCRNGMTQEKLAEALCYSNGRQIQRIENGEVACPVDRLMEIAQLFCVSTDYLLFGEGETKILELKIVICQKEMEM